MKGGKREGAGRPSLPAHMKKIPVSYHLPRWLVDWLRDQPGVQAQIIEQALVDQHHLRRPD
jgi:hypothetical protein